MNAILSGKYDTDKLAIIMTQTGGGCRASNYLNFIRRALEKNGLGHIPVISINANGMEKNSGFHYTIPMLIRAMQALIYGDLFMRMLYHVRPYELVPGSANELHETWKKKLIADLTDKNQKYGTKKFKANVRQMVHEFDTFPIHEDMKKPRVGIVGEILVKFLPLAKDVYKRQVQMILVFFMMILLVPLRYMHMCIQMILAIFQSTFALGAETELQIGIILLRAATDLSLIHI